MKLKWKKWAARLPRLPYVRLPLWLHPLRRLCLPLPPGDADAALQNAQRLEALQAWLAAQSAAHTAPVFGNYDTDTEALRTADAGMERADTGGTACYTLRLWADYTVAYTEKGELV